MLHRKQLHQFYALPVCILFILPILSAQDNAWKEMTPMPTARVGAGSAVLDGKIYVIGGLIDRSTVAQKIVEVYDPEQDIWETKNPFPVGVTGPPGTEIVNGTLYVIGGRNGFGQNATEYDKVWAYDPGTDSWEDVGEIPDSPNGIPSTCTVGNSIYSVGGAISLSAHGRNMSYNPDSNTWKDHPSLAPGRFNSSVVSRGNVIYVMGGTDIANTYKDLQEYNTETSTWTELASMPERRFYCEAVILDEKIYSMPGALSAATGGFDGRTFVYDIGEGTWSVDEEEVPETTVGYSLNVIGDQGTSQSIYLIGGATSDWWDNTGGAVVSNRVWKYEPVVASFEVGKEDQFGLVINPNPVSDVAHLRYQVPKQGTVRLVIYDMNGRAIDVLVTGEKSPGLHSIDYSTIGLSAGVYICTFQLNGSVVNKKIVVER